MLSNSRFQASLGFRMQTRVSEPALTLISLLSAGQSTYISTCLRAVYPPSPLETGNTARARAMGATQQVVHKELWNKGNKIPAGKCTSSDHPY